ncbi:dihydroorotate dehydrogenase [uncultured Lactobacillus sp.]|uniref:dihydroorotate dehydrogenase n=1 Tax=uncultured Lactobacillus sp. TaxID=153152 RepID=UPI00260439B9|nr:dihydroorotate dehydrogenase [uncultured Lactobacillus sp.]
MTNLKVNLPGLKLKNPLMPASGTFGFGDTKAAQSFDLNKLGAIVLKTTTKKAKLGNPAPQIALLDDGVMNSVGLTNPGAQQVVSEKILPLRQKYPNLPIIASVGGASIDDYVDVAQKLDQAPIDALEINISCPNVAQGGMHFGTDPETVEKLTSVVKKKVTHPIYVKLTPNVTDIVAIAQAAARAGADGLSMINTLLGLEIDVKTRKPVLGNGMGGLSGKAIQPLALRMIYQVHQKVDLPIIGMGGISNAQDIIKFFLAGASCVAVGSAHFKDPQACLHLAAQLEGELEKMGVQDINDLVGQIDF